MKLCQIWTCCSWYKYKSKKKSWWQKTKKKLFCRVPRFDTQKSEYFCRVLTLGTRQIQYFAECQTEGTRQRGRRWVPLSPGASLPSAQLCRVSHWAKFGFAECLILPSARHSAKPYLPSAKFRRVRHLAKIWALGKVPVSCSELLLEN